MKRKEEGERDPVELLMLRCVWWGLVTKAGRQGGREAGRQGGREGLSRTLLLAVGVLAQGPGSSLTPGYLCSDCSCLPPICLTCKILLSQQSSF